MKFLFQFFNFFLQFQMHICGTLSSRTQISLSLLITTLLSSPTFLLQKNPSTIGTHQTMLKRTMSNAHIGVHQTFAPRTMLKNGTQTFAWKMLKNGTKQCTLYIAPKNKAWEWHRLVYIAHCTKWQCSRMAHICVNCNCTQTWEASYTFTLTQTHKTGPISPNLSTPDSLQRMQKL